MHFSPLILIAINARNMSTITFHYHNFISKCKDFEGAFCFSNCFGLYNMCTKRRGGFALICLLFICSQLPVYYCLCCCFAFDCPKPLFVNLFLSILQLFFSKFRHQNLIDIFQLFIFAHTFS